MQYSCYFSNVGVLRLKEAGIQMKALNVSYSWHDLKPLHPGQVLTPQLCSALWQGAALHFAADRRAVSTPHLHQQHCPTAAPGGQAENSPLGAWKPREREELAHVLPSLTPAARQHTSAGLGTAAQRMALGSLKDPSSQMHHNTGKPVP